MFVGPEAGESLEGCDDDDDDDDGGQSHSQTHVVTDIVFSKYFAIHLPLLLAPHLEQLERCTALVELVPQILFSFSAVFVSTEISTYRLG